jgi:hypothetical protein
MVVAAGANADAFVLAAAELLSDAGNPIEPRFLDVADGPLAAWLEQREAWPPHDYRRPLRATRASPGFLQPPLPSEPKAQK